MKGTLFADSYAFLAAIDGSRAYVELLSRQEFVTTPLNLLEVAHRVSREHGASAAESAIRPLASHCVQFPVSEAATIALAAAAFRRSRQEAGADCSTVDAWGYATARNLDIPFLTGDESFRGVPGVKFVKQ